MPTSSDRVRGAAARLASVDSDIPLVNIYNYIYRFIYIQYINNLVNEYIYIYIYIYPTLEILYHGKDAPSKNRFGTRCKVIAAVWISMCVCFTKPALLGLPHRAAIYDLVLLVLPNKVQIFHRMWFASQLSSAHVGRDGSGKLPWDCYIK